MHISDCSGMHQRFIKPVVIGFVIIANAYLLLYILSFPVQSFYVRRICSTHNKRYESAVQYVRTGCKEALMAFCYHFICWPSTHISSHLEVAQRPA